LQQLIASQHVSSVSEQIGKIFDAQSDGLLTGYSFRNTFPLRTKPLIDHFRDEMITPRDRRIHISAIRSEGFAARVLILSPIEIMLAACAPVLRALLQFHARSCIGSAGVCVFSSRLNACASVRKQGVS
jgi:hypothetical protein